MLPSYTKAKRYLSRTRGSTISGSQIFSLVKMIEMIIRIQAKDGHQAREGSK